MKYSEWSKEYSDEGKKIKDHINELKAQLETASPSEISGIRNRISILLTMYLDCMETAAELMKKHEERMLNLGKKVQTLSGTQELLDYHSYISSKRGGDNSDIRNRIKKLIAVCIDTELTGRQKDCLTMRVYRNMRVEDIAAELGIRPTTVYKHIKKAKEALKKCRKYL